MVRLGGSEETYMITALYGAFANGTPLLSASRVDKEAVVME